MLVDNSIVVIENIYRLRSRGVGAARAAVAGTKQVTGAIIASTLTTVCVFFPMVYTTGIVRELMLPMCITIIFCLMASLLIAMTVVPAAGSTLLRSSKAKQHPWFDKIQEIYGGILSFCLKVKIIPLAIAVGLLILSIWQVVRMGIVLIPDMTSNQIEAALEYPEDTTREEAYALTDELIEKFAAIDGVGSVGVMSGGSESLITSTAGTSDDNYLTYTIMLLTEDENAGSGVVNNIVAEMNKAAAEVLDDPENCFSISTGMSEMSSMLGSGLSINIYGSDLDELREVSEEVMEIVSQVEGYTDISNGQEESDPVLHVVLDKDLAMSKGLTVAQIYQELSAKMTTSSTALTVTIDGVEMDIEVVDNTQPVTYENLMDCTFAVSETDEDGDTVTKDYKLSDFAQLQVEEGVTTITVTAAVEDGYNTTLLTRQLEPLLEEYKENSLPQGCTFDIGGEVDTVNEMVEQMVLVMLLGVAFIYLVMVAQFQSLLSPFIVLFTIPLAFTGGFMALWFTGEPLSMMSLLGFVVLLGTVVNNAIVFVDYANQLRIGGMERRQALIATGKTRMRPILMTALTTILAMAALIFGDDMGSQMGRGMALVISGGLAYATLMTLFIIPVMYDILFKRAPLQIDVGSDNLDDMPDDAAEYMEQLREKGGER
jgi:multidrug efflux pump subunit AcrB